jgi:1-acyl-sn-glycerol-3-phosphate acyltransferase
LVANHPNAFLDALIIAAFMKRPIHFLARGDAFNNKFFSRILKSFNLMPVYRISEGKENIGKNPSTFDATQEILKKMGWYLFLERAGVNKTGIYVLSKKGQLALLNVLRANRKLKRL